MITWSIRIHHNPIELSAGDFLTRRVKPDQKDYAERLAKQHAVIVAAMKAKQNANVTYAKILKDSIEALSSYYPEHDH